MAVVQSALSTQHIYVPVRSKIDPDWDPSDPAITVQMAFKPDGTAPEVADWQTASWEQVGMRWYARCNVGPAGDVALDPGLYTAWIKFTDNPEAPVIEAPSTVRIT